MDAKCFEFWFDISKIANKILIVSDPLDEPFFDWWYF